MCFWSEKIKTGQNALSVIISTIVKRPQIFLLWSEFQKTVFSSETSCNNIDLWFYFFVSGFLLLPQSHVEWNECDELPPYDWRKDLCQLMVLIGSNDYSETCCLLLRSRRKKRSNYYGAGWTSEHLSSSSSPRLLFSCGGINSSCCLFWKIEMERIFVFQRWNDLFGHFILIFFEVCPRMTQIRLDILRVTSALDGFQNEYENLLNVLFTNPLTTFQR